MLGLCNFFMYQFGIRESTLINDESAFLRQARQYPIPPDMRGAVWFRITGGEEYMQRLPERYARVLEQHYGKIS